MTRLLPLLVLVACGNPPVDESSDDLERAFRSAAAESRVPRDLLVALAYSESRLDARAGHPDEHGKVGLTGLRLVEGVDAGPSLDDAASAIGADPDVLRTEPEVEVRAAAALLADMAEEDLGEVPVRIEDWWPVIERWSGAEDPEVASAFANQVFHTLESGFVFRVHGGERVELVGRYVPGLYVDYDDRAATDYADAAGFQASATCNYTDASRTSGVDRIVLHTTQGSYSSCINWFKNCGASASAHYVVRSSDGQVTQMVDEQDIAWHAGNWSMNQRSVGVELEGFIDQPDAWYTDAMYRSAADLVRDVCDRNGFPCDRAHVLGHHEVPDPDGTGWGGAGNHTDPGVGFNWDYFMALVEQTAPAEVAAQEGDLYGFVRAGDVWDGAPIAGAQVRLSDGQVTSTDSGGLYRFYGLPAGVWTVTVSASGWQSASSATQVEPDAVSWASVGLTPVASPPSSNPSAQAPADNWPPSAPIGLLPSTTQTDDAVRLAWTDQGARSDLHEVELWVKIGSTWYWYYTWTTGGSEKWFWPSRRNALYSYRVRGKNAEGWGDYSGWRDFSVR